MSVTASTAARRCHHCAREVDETKHTRTSYRVGYYSVHGGEVETVTQRRSEDDPESVTFLRLITPSEAYTCAACYRLPDAMRERELLYRPETAASE